MSMYKGCKVKLAISVKLELNSGEEKDDGNEDMDKKMMFVRCLWSS